MCFTTGCVEDISSEAVSAIQTFLILSGGGCGGESQHLKVIIAWVNIVHYLFWNPFLQLLNITFQYGEFLYDLKI